MRELTAFLFELSKLDRCTWLDACCSWDSLRRGREYLVLESSLRDDVLSANETQEVTAGWDKTFSNLRP